MIALLTANISMKSKVERTSDKSLKRYIIATTMEFAIGTGLLISDLKPENFLFMNKVDEKCLKLIDFGLSKIFLVQEQGIPHQMQSSESSPIRKISKRVPKNNMKTRAGTVRASN